MKIEIKQGGVIVLTTQDNMFEMDKDELNRIEKAIKIARYLVEEMNVDTLLIDIK